MEQTETDQTQVEELFQLKGTSFWQLEKALDAVWEEARNAGEITTELTRQQALEVRGDSEGIVAEAVVVAMIFRPAINKIVIDLWTEILLRRLKAKLGSDALKPVERPRK